MYPTCWGLTLWLVELLSQLKMQNMTMKCSNIINYNNSDNIYTLTTAWHYHETHFALIIGLITISNTLLQLLTFKCTTVIYNFLCTIAIDYFCMHYCNWQLLYDLLQMTTIACCRTILRISFTLIATTHITYNSIIASVKLDTNWHCDF